MNKKEAIRAAQRVYKQAWREKNRDRINAYHRAWRRKNPDKVLQYNDRYWTGKARELKLIS